MVKVKINGKVIDLVVEAAKLGIQADAISTVELVRDVDAGELVAVMRTDAEPYPAVDVELRLPDSAKSCPILLSRSEQPRKDAQGEEDITGVRTYLYERGGDYMAFTSADVRSDEEFEADPMDPEIHAAGDPDCAVCVFEDDPYVRLKGD